MLFLALLIILNAALNNNTIVNKVRLEVGGLPISIMDGAVILCAIGALLRPRSTAGYYKTDRTHPVFWWVMGLFMLGLIGGMVGAMWNGATSRQIITCIRNYAAAPAALYAAYYLTANFKSAKWFLYLQVLAGVIASVMIVLYFQAKTETVREVNVIGIRAVMFVSAYAGLAVALLFYSLSANLRLMPLLLALAAIGICLVGQFATLSRSDWVACIAAVGVTVMLIPRERRMLSLGRMALATPFLIGSIILGLYFGSKITRKDLFDTMSKRLVTLLPGDHAGAPKSKAWDTRLPGILKELEIWAGSPIIGGGFGVHDTSIASPYTTEGLRHNSWTSTLAETGLIGFAAFSLMTGACAYCGLRLVREGTDRYMVLIGVLAVATASYEVTHGLATMSFNQVRWGLPLFVMSGVALRMRAMQLTHQRLLAEEQVYWEQNPELWAAAPADVHGTGYVFEEPVFGNWYQN